MENTDARKATQTMCNLLRNQCGINISCRMTKALDRYNVSYKQLTELDKRAFTQGERDLKRVFLQRHLGPNKRNGVWVVEFRYKA